MASMVPTPDERIEHLTDENRTLREAVKKAADENARLRAIAKEAMGECGTSTTTHHLLRQIVPDWEA